MSASSGHVLYRFFDQNGRLLYIGITCNPGARFNSHRLSKTWWNEIASITLERFSTRNELMAAERSAILSELPLHNIAGAMPGPTTRVLSEPAERWRRAQLRNSKVAALK
jgi:hypothetical protein